jgi:hypothetical protein
MQILCLCREDNLTNLLAEYEREFREQNVKLICAEKGTRYDTSLNELLKLCSEEPLAIFHPESDFPLFPTGLTQTQIPTICFQVDTYAYTERRYRWASLFDSVAVFHPDYVGKFRNRGHADPFLLPHAVRKALYAQHNGERTFDLGWVGQTHGPIYRRRESLLPQLAKTFRMNNWRLAHSPEQLAEVYQQSCIVVNIGRDDYPQDANLRTFEAMAGGALLITSLPSELVELGFQEGTDFIGYRPDQDLLALVKHYLKDETARLRIASAGRQRVLLHHTYEHRVNFLIRRLKQTKGALTAPARKWPESQVQLAYLDYYAANGALRAAAAVFFKIMLHNPNKATEGSLHLLRATGRKLMTKPRA